MKKTLSIIFALLGWFAVVVQYFIMMENRVESPVETTIRFFSFFTILTNTMVAIYFTWISIPSRQSRNSFLSRPGTLTALTLYITVVGLVYQIALRPIWDPQGLQKVVDELLHSVMPVVTVIFWYLYEQKTNVKFNQIGRWLIYPFCYLLFILLRGALSGFYPYPFVDVVSIGYQKVIFNSFIVLAVFVGIALLLVGLGNRLSRKG